MVQLFIIIDKWEVSFTVGKFLCVTTWPTQSVEMEMFYFIFDTLHCGGYAKYIDHYIETELSASEIDRQRRSTKDEAKWNGTDLMDNFIWI